MRVSLLPKKGCKETSGTRNKEALIFRLEVKLHKTKSPHGPPQLALRTKQRQLQTTNQTYKLATANFCITGDNLVGHHPSQSCFIHAMRRPTPQESTLRQ